MTDGDQPPHSPIGKQNELAELFGYRFVEFGDGHCLVEWRPRPPFVNLAGGVWGGAVSAISDNVCALAVVSMLGPSPQHLPTVSMHVDYLRRMRPDSMYLVRGEALRVGGRLAVADCFITDSDATLYARSTCTFAVRRHKAGCRTMRRQK